MLTVFLEKQYSEFRRKEVDDDKMVNIIHKTWLKISPKGRDAAMALAPSMSVEDRLLVEKALSS